MRAESSRDPRARRLRDGFVRDISVRVALGAVLGAAVAALSAFTANFAAWLGIDLFGAGAVVSGVVFGPGGAIGYWGGHALLGFVWNGSVPRLELLVAALLLGVGGFLA